MARLEAQAKALFYPTELRVIAGVARLLELDQSRSNSGPIRVIDPAAGTGRAVFSLVRLLQQSQPRLPLELYGIELDQNRAEECRQYLAQVLNTDAKSARITDRSFDLVFCNPPYDTDKLEGERRLEQLFLIKSTKILRAGGLLIWIIPRFVLEINAAWLAAFFKDHIIRRFPKPEADRFDQIVLVARRKAAKLPNPTRAEELVAMAKGNSEIKLLDCPSLPEFNGLLKELYAAGVKGPEIDQEIERLLASRDLPENVGVPAKTKALISPGPKASDKITFAYGEYHREEAFREAERAGVWSNPAKRDLLFLPPSRALVIKAPLMPMRIGMSSQFIQIGLGNNLLLKNTQRKIVIKGKTVKRWKNMAVELDEDGLQRKRVDREVISSQVNLLDLSSGELETLDPVGLGKLVEEFSASIQEQMLLNYPPLYVPLRPDKRQAQVTEALAAIEQEPTLAGPHNKNKRRKARQKARLIQQLELGLAYLKPNRKPLGGQKLAIPAAALSLKTYGYATLECEMGSGKSTMGIAAAWLAGAKRPVVVCPSTLLEKWVREVKATIPGAEAMIVSSISDLEEARKRIGEHEKRVRQRYNPDRTKGQNYPPFFTIMSKEQMKLESGWQTAVVYHPPRGETVKRVANGQKGSDKKLSFWAKEVEAGPFYPKERDGRLVRDKLSGKLLSWPHCPGCDSPITDRNGLPARLEKLEKRINCTNCGEVLWQRVSKLRGGGQRFDWEKNCRVEVPDPGQVAEAERLKQELLAKFENYLKACEMGQEDFQTNPAAGATETSATSSGNSAIKSGVSALSTWPGGTEGVEGAKRENFRPTTVEEEAGRWLATLGKGAYPTLYRLFASVGDAQANQIYASRSPQDWARVAELLAQASFCHFPRFQSEYADDWPVIPQYRDSLPAGFRKVKLSQYIQKRLNKFFDLCIIDEVHQMKARGSAQGVSAGRLAMACKWQLTLTGTYADGYSTMVMQLLWRFTDPKIRKLWGRHETGRWAKKYGIIKATRIGRGGAPDENEDFVLADGANSDRQIGGRVRFEEAPGISPELALLTIPHTVYLSLLDVSKDLPPYREFPNAAIPLRRQSDGVFGPEAGERAGQPLPSQLEAYHHLANKLMAELKQQLARGSTRLLGAMVHALLAWIDNPTRPELVVDPKTKVVVASAPALPATVLYPKEQKLVELYKRTKAEGKKLMIYIAYTAARDMAPRLKWVLQQADPLVRVAVLSGGDATKREAWIEKQLEQGCDVLITHPKKVEVGLDLLKFPVIVFYNVYYVTQTIEQAKKRAWRIGQTQPCETHFWAYGNTAQEKGLRHVARKIYSAMKLKGQIGDDGITELLGEDEDESMLKAIAQAITREDTVGDEAHSLEQLMSQTLEREVAEAAFILSDEAASELEVEAAIVTLYDQTFAEEGSATVAGETAPPNPKIRWLNTAKEEGEDNHKLVSNSVEARAANFKQTELVQNGEVRIVRESNPETQPSIESFGMKNKQITILPQKLSEAIPTDAVEILDETRPSLEEFRARLLATRNINKRAGKKNNLPIGGQGSLFN